MATKLGSFVLLCLAWFAFLGVFSFCIVCPAFSSSMNQREWHCIA